MREISFFVSGLGDHYFTPGAVTFDAEGRVLDDGAGLGVRTIEEQTRSVFQRIETALKEHGCGLEDIVDLTVWLSDPRDFVGFNNTYMEFFHEPYPSARCRAGGFHVRCQSRSQSGRLQATRLRSA